MINRNKKLELDRIFNVLNVSFKNISNTYNFNTNQNLAY
jgi:hypothetical protein